MRWPWRRSLTQPVARDIRDLTQFSVGALFGSPLTAHAALRRISGWIAAAARPCIDRLSGLQFQSVNDAGEEIERGKSRFVSLLRRPNPQMSGGLLLRCIASTLLLSGEAILVIRRGRQSGRPVELWPVSPDRVCRIWDNGELYYDISPGASQQQPERLPAADVIRAYRPRPDDLMEPWGVVAMCWREIQADQAFGESVMRWFQMDSRPQMALEFPEDAGLLQPPGFEQYLSDWQGIQSRRNGGFFGVPVPLPPGAKLKEMSGPGNSENLGPVELTLRNKVFACVGTPAFLVGFSAEQNRASATASLWAWEVSAVAPWAQIITDAINHSLGDEFENERVQFAPWITQDELAQSEIDQRLLEQKVVSPNEVRKRRNFAPAPWGEWPVGQMQDQPFTGETLPGPAQEK